MHIKIIDCLATILNFKLFSLFSIVKEFSTLAGEV